MCPHSGGCEIVEAWLRADRYAFWDVPLKEETAALLGGVPKIPGLPTPWPDSVLGAPQGKGNCNFRQYNLSKKKHGEKR